MYTQPAYLEQLLSFLPPGQAFPREAGSTLYHFLSIFAQELEWTDERAAALIGEADPRTTIELLEDWERVAGLPDNCLALFYSIAERRAALLLKVTGLGGQSPAFYLAQAELLGYEVEITEYRPFTFGLSQFGLHIAENGNTLTRTELTDQLNLRHNWLMRVLGARVTWFQFGLSEFGLYPFAKFAQAQDLECLMARIKPAHTHLIFSYDPTPDSNRLTLESGEELLLEDGGFILLED